MSPPGAVTVQAADDTTGITLPDPLTVNDVEELRTRAGKLKAGTAARADIELFKGKGRHAHKPLAKRWDRKCEKVTQVRVQRMP